MKTIARLIAFIFLGLIGLVLTLVFGLQLLIESRFETRINKNPDRAYNITFEEIELDAFFRGITLSDVKIQPLNLDSGTIIHASVDYATINGIIWRDFVFRKKLKISEIAFENPIFEVTLSQDSERKTSAKGLQAMFGDILSRAELNSFKIDSGSIVILDPITQRVKGEIKKLNVEARELKTDTLMWQHLIPFQLGSFSLSLDTMFFAINDYTELTLGGMSYSTLEDKLMLNDLSIDYMEDWQRVSKKIGVQVSLNEIKLDKLEIDRLETSSNLYSNVDLSAEKISIDGFSFLNYRDKNMPRPADVRKQMFKGMIESIPFVLKVDTIAIRNSDVKYTELGEGKSKPGVIWFSEVYGTITGITTIPDLQKKYGYASINIISKFNGAANMKVLLKVPYDNEAYFLRTSLYDLDMVKLNPTTRSMANTEIESGNLHQLTFEMDAKDLISSNSLTMDYTNLKISLLSEESGQQQKRRGLLSSIGNAAVRSNNMPDKGKYFTAKYETKRNIYRGPFTYIWEGLFNGILQIVPSKNVQKLIESKKKKNESNS